MLVRLLPHYMLINRQIDISKQKKEVYKLSFNALKSTELAYSTMRKKMRQYVDNHINE